MKITCKKINLISNVQSFCFLSYAYNKIDKLITRIFMISYLHYYHYYYYYNCDDECRLPIFY